MKRSICAVLTLALLGLGILISLKVSFAQELRRDFGAVQGPGFQMFPGNNLLPKNAQNVQQLVRAEYKLPSETVATLEQLFQFAKDNKVETKVLGNKTGKLVDLQVTTDVTSQRAIAEFLKNVFPEPTAEQIEAAEKANLNPSMVTLKLPGMT